MKFSSLFLTLAVAAVALSGCEKNESKPAATGEMDIELEHVVGAAALKLNTSQTAFDYTNGSGEPFNVTTFRYYVSNIKLKRDDGTEYVQPNSYYLVDEAKPATKHLTLTDIPVDDYTGLTFMVGVDAPRNTAGAQDGALAPSDMFWSWNSGYIFLKMEGYSPAAPGNHGLAFHIGGFADPNNALRTITPTVSPSLTTGVKMLVRTDHSPELHMKVDMMKMFTGPTMVSFATFAVPHMPGASAVLVASNYAAGMFEIEHIHAN